jgi:glycosyltransferase involved in cell wall biosynthesis
MAGELSRSTFMVLPTRADTGPTVVKEAAVAGVPVVGSHIGGIPDYITHGKNGLLFPAGNLDALTQALGEAMSHPLFSKGLVDQRTCDSVRKYLSPQRMGESFFGAYQQVLETWNKPQPI